MFKVSKSSRVYVIRELIFIKAAVPDIYLKHDVELHPWVSRWKK